MPTLTVLILAGGQSRRMGQDKALLEVNGVSLLRRTWDIGRTLTPEVRIVTSRVKAYRHLLPHSASWIVESPPSPSEPPPGPLVAFTQALAQVNTDWILSLPCDLPALQIEVLQCWIQQLPELPNSVMAYLPEHPKGWEPLCGFYRSRCLPHLKAYVAAGGRSFQQWLAHQSVQAIADVPVGMLTNCNTPEDWAAYLEQSS
ncbi:MAG: molybdenum cofactor guanylyltransferase [Cyanobacteria bacterium P01_H01_bin.152]